MMCGKCSKMTGGLLLLFGALFLLADVGVWSFWGIQWWTVLFLLAGLCMFASTKCPMCASCGTAPSKGKKK